MYSKNYINYWLLKSEPNIWSIEHQKKAGDKGVAWDGGEIIKLQTI